MSHWFTRVLAAAACWFQLAESAGCFLPSTKVTMADGSLRAIGEVKIGEWVTSWDEVKAIAVSAKVMNIKRTQRLDLMQVKCAKTNQSSFSSTIVSTRDHPYWSVKQQSLISGNPSLTQVNYGLEAKEFNDAEEVLQAMDGSGVKCEVVSRADSAMLREVLTLQLQEHHWFFVEGVRVHNKGGGGGCFVLDSKVTMADNSMLSIGEIQVGDSVMSWDEEKQISVPAKVMKIKRAKRSDLMKVQLSSSGEIITSTRDHPYWSFKQQSLISAEPENTKWGYDLDANKFDEKNEILQGVNGSGVHCSIVSKENSVNLTDVMTLFLDTHHWFFVQGVRVHNKGGGSSCFIPSTQITLADGIQTRAIGDIQIGDSVLSWNEQKEIATVAKVKNVRRAQSKDMLHVTVPSFSSSSSNTVTATTTTTIVSTSDHPYWSKKQNSLVSADPLSTEKKYNLSTNMFNIEKEILQAANGSGVVCTAKKVTSDILLDVITLELDEHHWFFAEGVRVHNKGSTGGSSGGSSASSGSYRGVSGTYYSTYYPYYPAYYSRSPYCSRYPYEAQCSSSGGSYVECGCVGTSSDSTSYAQYCPTAGLQGGCWLSGQATTCVPTSPQMPVTDSRYLAATVACAQQISSCQNTTECTNEMSNNNYSIGILYWTNFSTISFPANVSDEFSALSQCMNNNINFCQCEWEVCEVNKTSVYIGAGVGGGILACCCFIFCCWAYGKKSRSKFSSAYQTRNPMIDSCKHVFQAIPCVELATRTRNNLYNEGFICDVCKGSFAVNIKPTHCFDCGLDFCDGCLLNLGGGAQELPQYNEPRSAACLENPDHAPHTRETRCAEMGTNYQEGFICDACHGKFPYETHFERCSLCSLDFCSGCNYRRVKTAPPVAYGVAPVAAYTPVGLYGASAQSPPAWNPAAPPAPWEGGGGPPASEDPWPDTYKPVAPPGSPDSYNSVPPPATQNGYSSLY